MKFRVLGAGFLGVHWFVWAAVAGVVAMLFTAVQIPKQTPNTTGLTHFVLRWFHAITWALLAVSFFLRGLPRTPTAGANAVAFVGLGAYIVFQTVLIRT